MEESASFGYWVRRRRKALDLTQDALAQQVGCSVMTIRKIESDIRRPSRQIAERLAQCLAIAPEDHQQFIRAARAELAVDRLTVPPPSISQVLPNHATRTSHHLHSREVVEHTPVPEFVLALPSGAVTFLFTDIEGSTPLWEQHRTAMHAALARHDTIVREKVELYHGVVFKTSRDSVQAVFTQAEEAIRAALAAQRALQAEPWGETGPLRVRMALHTGVAEIRDGDYFGSPINRIAHLLAVGHGGQILLSRATEELVHDRLPSETTLHDLGEHRLKGLSRPEHIFQLVPPDLLSDFPPLTTTAALHHSPTLVPSLHSDRLTAVDSMRSDRNRRRILAKVRDFWIKGVLEKSLLGVALITVDLEHQPQAVADPWMAVVQHSAGAPTQLAPGTMIQEIFDTLDRELLILGAPGAGKTTLLLELARTLLDRAEQDAEHPLPIVFNLSSWATHRRSLAEWLIDELNLRYDVPRRIGRAWVETDQLLPLLDGLDEMQLEQRAACVAAINAFRGEHGLTGLVVCSRDADYELLTMQLRLQGAIRIQPLTDAQIASYLQSSEQLASLRNILEHDPALWELASSPLLLNIMTLAYAGASNESLPVAGEVVERRQQILAAYVDRMFARRGLDQRYARQQTIRWLTWLARGMLQQSQSVFLIERLQPHWLPTLAIRWQYWLIDRLAVGVIVGVAVGSVAGLGTGLFNDVDFGRGFGLTVGVITALIIGLFGGACPSYGGGRWSTKWLITSRIAMTLGLMLVGGLGFGLVMGQIGVSLGMLVGGLVSGLAMGLIGLPDVRPRCITTVETLRWSSENALITAKFGFLGGFVSGLILGVVDDLFIYREVVGESIRWGVISGVFFGLIFGCITGLVGGLVSSEVEATVRPNQGIRRSINSAAVAGLIGGLLGLVGGLIIGLLYERPAGELLSIGLAFMLLSAMIGALAYGGQACLSHLALRLVLWHQGLLPWNIARFLDYATERIFLREVGGGYIFVHRLLLEYFATLDDRSRAIVSRDSDSSILEPEP